MKKITIEERNLILNALEYYKDELVEDAIDNLKHGLYDGELIPQIQKLNGIASELLEEIGRPI